MKLSVHRKLLFLAVSTAMFVLALPPNSTGFTAWLAFIPLLVVLHDTRNVQGGLLWGLVFGLMVSSTGFWWLVYPSGKGMVASILYLSLFWALAGGVYALIDRMNRGIGTWLFPVIILFMEYARGFGRLGFPWHDLAYTQTYYRILIQYADITGPAGVSFWVAALNVAFFMLITYALKQDRRRLILAATAVIIMFAGPLIYGKWAINRYQNFDRVLKAAVLQANIDPYTKWDREHRHLSMDRYTEMIDSVARQKPDLIVMPESATAGYWRRRSTRFDLLTKRAKNYGIPILTGTLDYDPENRHEYYNAAYFINPFGKDEVYFKMQLVPMSEQIPWQENSEFLRELDVGGSHFTRGSDFRVFEMPIRSHPNDTARFGVGICYEALFPEIIRQFRKRGANLILNITNDGWFKRSPGAWQNLRFNVFRAIENRTYIIRSANTGVSCFVDPTGIIYSAAGLYEKATMLDEVGLAQKRLTLYTEHGNVMGFAAFISVLLLSVIGLFRKGDNGEI